MVSVYCFVPNLIGYTRVSLSLASFIFYQRPWIFVPCYFLSFVLDALDGTAARAFNQCSSFGAILDMLTDRGSVICLYTILCVFFPAYAPVFMIAGFLDIVSHYAHMYKSLKSGEKSHKNLPKGTFFFLRLYYEKRNVMGLLCVGHELFLLAVYMLHFIPVRESYVLCKAFLAVLGVLWLLKLFAHVCQLNSAMWWLADFDEKERAKETKH